jgi:hypothetical protein
MSTINASSLLQMRASILQQNSALQKASAGSNAVDGLQNGVVAPGGGDARASASPTSARPCGARSPR